MGPELEKSKVEIGGLNRKDNGSVTQNQEDNLLQCASNYEDNNFHEEVMNDNSLTKIPPAETEDVEVNIVGCTKSGEFGQVAEASRYEDCTESMSSFGDTLSGDGNGSLEGGMEVDSRFCFDGAPAPFDDDYDGEFPKRRKKLTDHWRRFIRPIMWRCKWVELQIKEFESQAQKYDRELEQYAQRKLFDFVEGSDTKSLPFSSCTERKKVVKRKKRKRVEEMTDISSYMLQHNLFSYYENRKSAVGGGLINNDCSNLDKANTPDEFGLQDEWPSFDCKGNENIHENFLRKIELLQSQVRTLKARIQKVENDNPGKFSYVDMLPETSDMLTNSDQDPASPPENRDQTSVGSKKTLSPHKSNSKKGDVLPESAVSSHGEVTPASDMIDSTSRPQLGVSGENTRERVLKAETVVKEEMPDLLKTESQLMEKNQELVVKHIVKTSADEMPTDTLAAARANFGGKTLPKHRSNTSNKRSRGKRKSRRGGWNRKK